jgi:hypothetical protein
MNRLEKLVTLLIAPHQPPLDTTIHWTEDDGIYEEDHEYCNVLWRKNKHLIRLEACNHRILICASFDDGGACPPSRIYEYSHMRLTMLLNWMNQQFSVEALDALNSSGMFLQKFDTDPPITKRIYGGYIDELILREAEKMLPNDLTPETNVL